MRLCDLKAGDVWLDTRPNGGVMMIVEIDAEARTHRWTWLLRPTPQPIDPEGYVYCSGRYIGKLEERWTRDEQCWEKLL